LTIFLVPAIFQSVARKHFIPGEMFLTTLKKKQYYTKLIKLRSTKMKKTIAIMTLLASTLSFAGSTAEVETKMIEIAKEAYKKVE
jgi:hypothetical protein